MIVPFFIFTLIAFFVVCCTTAIPAPAVVLPLPFGVVSVGIAVPIIVPPFTFNSPARISIPVLPSILAPSSIVHTPYPAA